ncbi:uncharacterized protein LOC131848209 [Achroia grisella]|uniref:uncharacterized protein LOC131848209 n=1 Tax=Achroia grisella TaxID=688607 RepID=UPI0027D2006E|nr:uncharacterized protein LOC131848209 [Achroia grisella]
MLRAFNSSNSNMAYTMNKQEKLIELVKQRPMLYDLRDANNKNRSRKAKAWLEIAKEMGSNDGSLWRYKWKGLKDNYTKYKKSNQTSTGPGYKKYKNWPWAEHMKFLDNFHTMKWSKGNWTSSRHQREETYNSNSHNVVNVENSTVQGLEDSHKFLESVGSSSINSQLQSHSQSSDERYGVTEKLDGTDYFFLSYSQTFKKLPNRMQTTLKLEIATLFARYESIFDDGEPAAGSSHAIDQEHENCDLESLGDPLTDAIKLEMH